MIGGRYSERVAGGGGFGWQFKGGRGGGGAETQRSSDSSVVFNVSRYR